MHSSIAITYLTHQRMLPVRSKDNPRAFERRRETMGQPARRKDRTKRWNQRTPISPRSQPPDMIASQPQMPLTPPEQNAPPAVGNLSSAVETEAVGPTVTFLASNSPSRDGGELLFASCPQQQLGCHDSPGSHIPNSLKHKLWGARLYIYL